MANETINWYPGHMKKATRMMEDSLRLVDAVVELRDARIPNSSRNPDVERIVGSKPRLIVLNRADQADAAATALWKKALTGEGALALEMDCKSGRGVNAFPSAARALLKEKIERAEAKGQVGKALRFMVLGVPNVGKSSFINRLAGRKAAETSDRPGVTRGKQWITLNGGILLLDTPGILWPKLDSPEVGYSLPGRARSMTTSWISSLSPAGCSSTCASFTPARSKRAISFRPIRKLPATSCSKPRRESAAFSSPAAKSIPSAWRTSCSMNSAKADSGA